MFLTDGLNSCSFQTSEDLDQQLLRISQCDGGVIFSPSPEMESNNDILYELPQTALRVNAPLDATKIDPGEPVTEQPAPQVSVSETLAPGAEVATNDPINKMTDFIKKNPLLVGGAAVAVLYLLGRKKR